ncbi:MAG: GGDEF domain-containing protein, partial [Solirubrobacterales bacterium]
LQETLYMNLLSVPIVISYILQYNARKLASAEAAAEQMALLDPLTGIANRRAFESDLATAIDNASSVDVGVERPGLILVDLDDFKDINTEFGHQGGDALLRATAEQLRDSIDDDGKVFRIGGDEFAILVSARAAQTAHDVSERCRAAVHRAGQGLSDRARNAGVSASFGFAIWHPSLDRESLIVAADRALERSKHNGKDVVSAAGLIAV